MKPLGIAPGRRLPANQATVGALVPAVGLS